MYIVLHTRETRQFTKQNIVFPVIKMSVKEAENLY